MADEKKQGKAAKPDEPAASAPVASEPEAPEAPVGREPSRYTAKEHITMARGMHGVRKHEVAAALALIERKEGSARDGYTKSEVADALVAARSTKVKESSK